MPQYFFMIFLALFLAAPRLIFAETTPPKKTQMSATLFEFDGATRTILATGNVHVARDTMTLDGETAFYQQPLHRLDLHTNVHLKENGISLTCDKIIGNFAENTLTAIGKVDMLYADYHGTAGQAFVMLDRKTVALSESPVLTQGNDRIVAKKIVVDFQSHRVVSEGRTTVQAHDHSAR